MIHIGDSWGKKYDFMRFYVPFVLRYGIRFTHWQKHSEILRDPAMYDKPDFVPMTGSVVFDIGSQYGDYALLWEKRNHAVVFAFEALPENYSEMLQDFDLNRSSIYSVCAFVGNGNPVEFENTGTIATRKESLNPHVSTMKIDDFVEGKGIIPHIIKIDVEGFEYEVLEGMHETLRKFHPKIIMETHSSELRSKCSRFLDDIGYEQWYEGRSIKGMGWMDEIVNLFFGEASE